jgi:RNA polymerase sigma-70 factor (TIGR02957 family)
VLSDAVSVERLASADALDGYRPLLFSIAYRMLGRATDAEDIVQEAFARYTAASRESGDTVVRSPKALLCTIATHLCLDELKAARTHRETYVGSWLPEPLLTADRPLAPLETVEQRESISLGFLVLLEQLSPAERAVFVLREAFDYTYDDIAALLTRSASACRQLHHRAAQRLADGRSRFHPAPETRGVLVEQFIQAAQGGDVQMLTDLLAHDAVMISDGGGKVAAPLKPIEGADRIIRFILGTADKLPPDTRMLATELNGQPGLVALSGHTPIYALTFEVAERQIHTIHAVANPDKLVYLERQFDAQSGQGKRSSSTLENAAPYAG